VNFFSFFYLPAVTVNICLIYDLHFVVNSFLALRQWYKFCSINNELTCNHIVFFFYHSILSLVAVVLGNYQLVAASSLDLLFVGNSMLRRLWPVQWGYVGLTITWRISTWIARLVNHHQLYYHNPHRWSSSVIIFLLATIMIHLVLANVPQPIVGLPENHWRTTLLTFLISFARRLLWLHDHYVIINKRKQFPKFVFLFSSVRFYVPEHSYRDNRQHTNII
jgi:hypothetical protein